VAEPWEWQRLGESIEFGEVMLELLERHGWRIERRAGFAGEGVLLIATRGDLERHLTVAHLSAEGPTIAAAALSLFNEISFYPSLLHEADAVGA
jgi:hypothetical protein